MKSLPLRNNTNFLHGLRFIGILFLGTIVLLGCQPKIVQSQPTPAATQTPFLPQATDTITPLPSSTPTPLPTATPLPLHPQQFPDPSQAKWVAVMQGLPRPVDIQSSPGVPDLLFIVEKGGVILKVNRQTFESDLFMDIQGHVGTAGDEQGLLGLAFPPTFPTDSRIYVNYTDPTGTTHISRFKVDPYTLQVDSQSEEILITVQQPYANHNGGGLAFGPDGFLYIGLGDGGSGGDPLNNAQNRQTLLGKLLRIDVSEPQGYTIPADNPFTDTADPEIWAYGLRNPWRFSFDPLSGNLYIGDVGQDAWEEIDVLSPSQPAGANLGWPAYEGLAIYKGGVSEQEKANLIFPAAVYDHNQGCSVTGGLVYRGEALPDFQGVYLYGDFCSGTIWGMIPNQQKGWTSQVLFNTGSRINSFGRDAAGEIYYLDYKLGTLYQLQPSNMAGN